MLFKKKMAILLSAALVVSAMTGCATQSTQNAVVANYTQGAVDEADLNKRLIRTAGMQNMLDAVDKGILDAVEPVTEEMTAEVDQNIENIKEYYQDDFESSMKFNGFDNVDQFKEALLLESQRKEYTLNYIVSTMLTDDEIKAYYDNFEPEIQASHILITPEDDSEAAQTAAEEQAKDLISRINEGEDFAELAKEFSSDPGSGANGGDLGSFGKGMMVPEFEEAAFALAVDEVTQAPVKSQFGYHIIKKTGGLEKTSFEEMKDEMSKRVADEKLQADQSLIYKALVQLRTDNGLDIKNPVIAEQYQLFTEQVNK